MSETFGLFAKFSSLSDAACLSDPSLFASLLSMEMPPLPAGYRLSVNGMVWLCFRPIGERR